MQVEEATKNVDRTIVGYYCVNERPNDMNLYNHTKQVGNTIAAKTKQQCCLVVVLFLFCFGIFLNLVFFRLSIFVTQFCRLLKQVQIDPLELMSHSKTSVSVSFHSFYFANLHKVYLPQVKKNETLWQKGKFFLTNESHLSPQLQRNLSKRALELEAFVDFDDHVEDPSRDWIN